MIGFRSRHCEQIKTSSNDKITVLLYVCITLSLFKVLPIHICVLILLYLCNIGKLRGVFYSVLIYSFKE